MGRLDQFRARDSLRELRLHLGCRSANNPCGQMVVSLVQVWGGTVVRHNLLRHRLRCLQAQMDTVRALRQTPMAAQASLSRMSQMTSMLIARRPSASESTGRRRRRRRDLGSWMRSRFPNLPSGMELSISTSSTHGYMKCAPGRSLLRSLMTLHSV